MLRKRTLDPELLRDDRFSELPVGARLLMVALPCLADRNGRLWLKPKRIKADLFPYDDGISAQDIQRWIEALAAETVDPPYLILYKVGDAVAVEIQGFVDAHRPHPNEMRGAIPGPDDIKFHGAPGHSMEGHDVSGNEMKNQETPWHSMEVHEIEGNSMESNDISLNVMECHDISGSAIEGHDISGNFTKYLPGSSGSSGRSTGIVSNETIPGQSEDCPPPKAVKAKKKASIKLKEKPRRMFSENATRVIAAFKGILLDAGVSHFRNDWHLGGLASAEKLLKAGKLPDELITAARYLATEWECKDSVTHFSHVANNYAHYERWKASVASKGKATVSKGKTTQERLASAEWVKNIETGRIYRFEDLRFVAKDPRAGVFADEYWLGEGEDAERMGANFLKPCDPPPQAVDELAVSA